MKVYNHHNEENGNNKVKMHQNFIIIIIIIIIINNMCHITKWILLIFKNALFFFRIPLMASLNILCSDPNNFLKEITPKIRKEALFN